MTKERELLEETLLFLDEFEYPTIVEEIRAYLAAEEERKPKFIRKKVCWNCGWPIQETRPEPAIRKPMTDREIMEQAKALGFDDVTTIDFAIGVRYAEKHHGILEKHCGL